LTTLSLFDDYEDSDLDSEHGFVSVATLVEVFPSMNARMSSLSTLPSLPVEGTFDISMPCLLAIERTAGVASAL
jgi:hypothetical protein